METDPQMTPNTQYVPAQPAQQQYMPAQTAQPQYAPVQYAQPQQAPVQYAQMQPARKKEPSGWGIFILCCIGLGLFTIAEVIGFFIGDATPIGWDMGSVAGGAIGGIIIVVALGGSKLLCPTRESWETGWKVGWWFVAISAILLLLDLASVLLDDPSAIQSGWFLRFFEAAILCACIGIGEEIMARGLALGGLLAPLGKTKAGMWVAIVLSSLFFGILHIDFETTNFADSLQLAQAILKVAQTGVYGFALACLVVATDDLMTAAVLHGLDDFLLFIVSVVLLNEGTSTEYVTPDESEAWITIGVYIVITLLYLPVAIKAAKLVMKMPEPSRGVFYESRHGKKAAVAAPVMPAQPVATPGYAPVPGFANSSQNATALDAATLSESTSLDMGMMTVSSDASTTGFDRP